MAVHEINPLIQEKLSSDVTDTKLREFIKEILVIERDHRAKTGKMKKYEKALARYVRG